MLYDKQTFVKGLKTAQPLRDLPLSTDKTIRIWIIPVDGLFEPVAHNETLDKVRTLDLHGL